MKKPPRNPKYAKIKPTIDTGYTTESIKTISKNQIHHLKKDFYCKFMVSFSQGNKHLVNNKYEKFKRVSGRALAKLLEQKDKLSLFNWTKEGPYEKKHALPFEDEGEDIDFCKLETIEQEIEKIISQVPYLERFLNLSAFFEAASFGSEVPRRF